MHTADLDYLQQADDKLESAEGKILDHCGRKEKELHSMVDRKDTAGSNMEEEVIGSKMKEEEVIGSNMKEEEVVDSKMQEEEVVGNKMEEEVVDSKMQEEEVVEEENGSKMEEEAVGRQVTDLKDFQHLYPSVHQWTLEEQFHLYLQALHQDPHRQPLYH